MEVFNMIKTKKIIFTTLLTLGLVSVAGSNTYTTHAMYDPNKPVESEEGIQTKMLHSDTKATDEIMTITSTSEEVQLEEVAPLKTNAEETAVPEVQTTSASTEDDKETILSTQMNTTFLFILGAALLIALAVLWKKKK